MASHSYQTRSAGQRHVPCYSKTKSRLTITETTRPTTLTTRLSNRSVSSASGRNSRSTKPMATLRVPQRHVIVTPQNPNGSTTRPRPFSTSPTPLLAPNVRVAPTRWSKPATMVLSVSSLPEIKRSGGGCESTKSTKIITKNESTDDKVAISPKSDAPPHQPTDIDGGGFQSMETDGAQFVAETAVDCPLGRESAAVETKGVATTTVDPMEQLPISSDRNETSDRQGEAIKSMIHRQNGGGPKRSAEGVESIQPPEKRSRSETVTSEEEEEEEGEENSRNKNELEEDGQPAVESKDGKFNCSICQRDFQSARMLQQHNQNIHTDKHFVCEICSKAFRFRSNLAEHRSVHTALKPFVCKYCGKSSRLKGNLTKHILKHHKTEQLDYIGTDDIIIKKGKKSVKDPAAIDFLEKSMIVLNTGAQTTTSNGQIYPNSSHPYQRQQTPSSRHSTSNMSAASDGSATPLNGKLGPIMNDRCFLMSLGLDAGSLDLKAESSESDSSVVGSLNTTNDQLLEKCNLLMEAEDGDQNVQFANTTTDEMDDSGEDADHVITLDRDPSTTPPPTTTASSVLASAATAFINSFSQPASTSTKSIAATLNALSAANQSRIEEFAAAQKGRASGTTCPECGKHVRKPRDLITHLATIHGIAPSAQQQLNGSDGAEINVSNSVQSDLRQILQLVLEMKGSVDQNRKIEQLVSNVDSRMTRLEKQMEMTLNSIYTLVQLQTATNSQLTRFRDDALDQLKTILQNSTSNSH
ncbi:Zinc finger protein, protein [Aphelenchoides besseyi]|nr:Zinc finger protein, protein [Aphelenchoides besseyi]